MPIKQTSNPSQLIKKLLEEKVLVKNKTIAVGQSAFEVLADEVKLLAKDIKSMVTQHKDTALVEQQQPNEFETVLTIGEDTIIFTLHSNAFNFDRSHSIWKDSYVSDNEHRAYCAVINVYNFLSDSYTNQRQSDIGYLVARIFINYDNHFFVEGKRQLGFLYNDFANAKFTKTNALKVLQSVVLYALDFDLLVPPYEEVKMITISEIQAAGQMFRPKTGKRLGFQFKADRMDEGD